jgi:hypothetical protein
MDKSVARKKPAAGIRNFNDASLVLFVFVATQCNGSCSGEISILLGPMVRITVDAMIFIPRPKLLERPFSSRCQRWQAPHGRALSGLMFFLP